MRNRVQSAIKLKLTHDKALMTLLPEFNSLIESGVYDSVDAATKSAESMDKLAYDTTFKAMEK